MERRYRLKDGDTPDTLAKKGGGHKSELYMANKSWMASDFTPWNPGQQMTIPAAWNPIDGEYPS